MQHCMDLKSKYKVNCTRLRLVQFQPLHLVVILVLLILHGQKIMVGCSLLFHIMLLPVANCYRDALRPLVHGYRMLLDTLKILINYY